MISETITRQMFLVITIFICYGDISFSSGIETDYLTKTCNTAVTVSSTRRLESSTAIVYQNNMDCTYTVKAGQNTHKLAVIFDYFEMENAEPSGNCLDYVTLHDGDTITSPSLNSAASCGVTAPINVTSSGPALTLRLKTDSSAVNRGFYATFVTFAEAPCDDVSFDCGNGRCIATSLTCDNYNQCGNSMDEANCETTTAAPVANNTGLIVGVTIGLAVLAVVIVIVGVKYYRYRLLQKLLKEAGHFQHIPPIRDPPATYPVTEKYWKKRPYYDNPNQHYSDKISINGSNRIYQNQNESNNTRRKSNLTN